MLVLTRRCGETIKIDEYIDVTVLSIKNNQLRLGIEAPKQVPVHREEIYQQIKQSAEPKEEE